MIQFDAGGGMVPVLLAFLLAAASAVDVLNPALRNSPFENLRELEAASAEGLTDLEAAESADVRHSVRSFFRQQTKRPPNGVPAPPTPAAVLLHNLKNEDIDLAAAEKILQNRKRVVSEHKRAAETPIPNAVHLADNNIEEEDNDGDVRSPKITTPGPFTPGFTDDAFYTSEPTSVPYTFESFPKIDLGKIRTTPTTATSEEGGGEEDLEVDTPGIEGEAEVSSTTEAVEVVYPSAEVFTEEQIATPSPSLEGGNQTKRFDSAVVIQPTLSSGPLATFQDINAFLSNPLTSGPAEEVATAVSLSDQLEKLEEQLIRESGETELLRETPKRKRKVGDPSSEGNALRSQLPLPASAPPTRYRAPKPPPPESMEYIPVEEVVLEDVPLKGGGGGGDVGESFLVVSKDDVALSERVKEATHGWDDLDDDIITAIERVLAIDIPVDSKLLYRNPSPRVTRKSPKFPGSENEIAGDAKVKPTSRSSRSI